MRRVGNLMDKIVDVDNLLAAYYNAAKGKRWKREVIKFSACLFDNVLMLRERLLAGTMDFGKYNYFKIYDPKERMISAARFEERVVHHAAMRVCEPHFERHLISDTYATRKGKGVYAAIDKARVGMRRMGYVAKLDVRKYFDSIHHDVLKVKLRRLFKDRRLLAMMDAIIDSYEVTSGRGIPIGNLTSQYFANYYLSFLDHFVKETLRVPVYVRYMDDMLVFGENKEVVKGYVAAIKHYVESELLLQLKPEVLMDTEKGVSFLGYSVYRHKILLNRRSKLRLKRKYRLYTGFWESEKWDEEEYMAHMLPLMAFAEKAYTKQLRKRICS